MRGAPHVGFSATMRKIKARISLFTGLRPTLALALESHFQYSRNPARCQPTTVLGVTRIRGSFHRAQRLSNPTQNSLSAAGLCWSGSWRRPFLEPKLTCANEWVVFIRDDRRKSEEIFQHGFRCAVGPFDPSLIVGIGFTYDEDIRICALDQL